MNTFHRAFIKNFVEGFDNINRTDLITQGMRFWYYIVFLYESEVCKVNKNKNVKSITDNFVFYFKSNDTWNGSPKTSEK